MSPREVWQRLTEAPLTPGDVLGILGAFVGTFGIFLGDSIPAYLITWMGGMCSQGVVMSRMERAHQRRMAALNVLTEAANQSLIDTVERLVPVRKCPRCGRETYQRTDIEQGYCGACNDWT